MTGVSLQEIQYTIGATPILRGVSCSIGAGQHCTIVGPNGAGKSTLLKVVARIICPNDGKVLFAGQSAASLSTAQHAQLIGYVPQHFESEFPHQVLDFVLMGLYPVLGRWAPLEAEHFSAARTALDLVGMAGFEDRLMRTLSGGERQRILLAGALVHQPKVLLLDEPTTFLDPRHEYEIERLLARIRRERAITVIAVSHNLNLSALTSDSIVALKDGGVAFSGCPGDFMQQEILSRVFNHEFDLVRHPHSTIPMVLPRPL